MGKKTIIGVRYPELVRQNPRGGSMDAMSLPKPPCNVVSFQFDGMRPGLTCMRLVTLEQWLTGYKTRLT